jgi:hypothetical protein
MLWSSSDRGAQDARLGQLGYSSVRLLPKDRGVRPIANLGRKPVIKGVNRPKLSYDRAHWPQRDGGKETGLSINQKLDDAKHILRYEQVCSARR